MVIVHCFMQATPLEATHPRSFTIIIIATLGPCAEAQRTCASVK